MNETASPASVRISTPERVEHGLLLALAFVLPLFEAPKNLLWIAFVALWIWNRSRARDFGGRWDGWDTLIALWIASGYAVALFAGLHENEWRAAGDIVRYGSILWLLRRSRYSDEIWRALLVAIVAGAAVTLAWGYFGLLVTKERHTLGLKSVGHVNHSAIYLAIVFGVALMAARAWWRKANPAWRSLGFASLALFVVSLFWMQSRGAVGAAFVMALLLLSVYAVRRRRRLRTIALTAAVAVGAAMLLNPQVVEKNIRFTQEGKFLNVRDGVWRVALAAWREFPLFGLGMDNFGGVGYQQLESWSAKRGETFDRSAVLLASHGHSLYVNTLAERGVVGLGILVAVLTAWAVALIRRVPGANAPPLVWTYWGGAAGAWTIAIVVGAVNTTLHHEHALLSMLLLGGWLSLSRPAHLCAAT